MLDQILLPDRPVVLCWYTAPQSFTARNPIEAELVAELTDRLSQLLWDEREDQNGLFTPEQFARRGIAVLSPHRAQKKAVVVCSEQVLNVVPTDRQVLLDSMMLKEFRRYCDDGHLVLPWQSATAGAMQIHIQWKSF